MKYRTNPYVTVMIVWIVSSFGLAVVVSYPVSYVLLFFAVLSLVLAVIGYLLYKAHYRDLNNRDLARNLSSGFRRFFGTILEDFGFVAARMAAWWLRREVQIQREIAQDRERKARKREWLEQKRRANPTNGYDVTREPEDTRRDSQAERTEE